jgi:hypothetical protein
MRGPVVTTTVVSSSLNLSSNPRNNQEPVSLEASYGIENTHFPSNVRSTTNEIGKVNERSITFGMKDKWWWFIKPNYVGFNIKALNNSIISTLL